MDDKVLAFFFWNQGIATVWTVQFHRGESIFIRRESRITDFTEKLSLETIVFVQKGFRYITSGAGASIRNITFGVAADWAESFAIASFVIRNKLIISPVLAEVGNERKFINLELLIFRGMEIIKSPLFERNVSTYKVNKPAILLVKILNYRK